MTTTLTHPWLSIILMTLLVSLFTNAAADGEAECTYDLNSQHEEIQRLLKKYPCAEPTGIKNEITIPRGNNTYVFRRGGCNHLGISITLKTPSRTDYTQREVLFSKALELIKEFGEFTDPAEIRKLIKANKYDRSQVPEVGTLYSIHHPLLSDFVIIYKREGAMQIIEVSYYRTY